METRWFDRGWIRVALALALMAALLLWVGPTEVWSTLAESRWKLVLASLLFTPVVIAFKVWRWFLLARSHGVISFRAALSSYLAGLTLAVLTPLSAGEAARALFVRTDDRAGLTGKVILDKLVDLSTVSVFASLGLIATGEAAAQGIGVVVLVVVLAAWGGMLGLLPTLKKRVAGVESRWLVRLRIPAVINGLSGTPRVRLFLNMALSCVGFAVFYAQAFVLMRAFWAEAPWGVVAYFPIITLSTILPIAVGGVGVREWTAVLLLRRFGVTEAVAVDTFFAHFVIVQVLPALVGAFIAGSFRWGKTGGQGEDAAVLSEGLASPSWPVED